MRKEIQPKDGRGFIALVLHQANNWTAAENRWNRLKIKKQQFGLKDLKKFGPVNRFTFLLYYYRLGGIDSYKKDLLRNTTRLVLDHDDAMKTWLSLEQLNSLLFPLVLNPKYNEVVSRFLKDYKRLLPKMRTAVKKHLALYKKLRQIEEWK